MARRRKLCLRKPLPGGLVRLLAGPDHCGCCCFLRSPVSRRPRFLLQLVGVLLDDISSRRVKVDITEQQHTFYCQQLGTLLMCLIHVFKSGEHRNELVFFVD